MPTEPSSPRFPPSQLIPLRPNPPEKNKKPNEEVPTFKFLLFIDNSLHTIIHVTTSGWWREGKKEYHNTTEHSAIQDFLSVSANTTKSKVSTRSRSLLC
jgi:hypothetical protein